MSGKQVSCVVLAFVVVAILHEIGSTGGQNIMNGMTIVGAGNLDFLDNERSNNRPQAGNKNTVTRPPPDLHLSTNHITDDSYMNDTDFGMLELPIDMNLEMMNFDSMMMMSNAESADELSHLLGITEPMEGDEEKDEKVYTKVATTSARPNVTAGRFGAGRGAIEKAMNARCEVENTMVELDLPRMRGSMLFPSCVRLQRCRGCCVGELIECQPTIYKPVTLQLIRYSSRNSRRKQERRRRTRSTGTEVKPSVSTGQHDVSDAEAKPSGLTRTSRGRITISKSAYTLEEQHHGGCMCQCRVKEHQCDPITQYHSGCACHCKETEIYSECLDKAETHDWDKTNCTCTCKNMYGCSTGKKFSHDVCSCVLVKNDIFTDDGTGAARHG